MFHVSYSMKLFDKIFKKKEEKQRIKRDKKEEKKKIEKIKKAEKKPEIREPVAKKQSGLIGKEKIKKEASEAYKVLRQPWITEKATDSASQNKYIFKIFPGVNKTEIKKTVEKLYGVRVIRVNIVNIPRKERRFGRRRQTIGYKSGYKKAVVTLKEGQKIEVMPH